MGVSEPLTLEGPPYVVVQCPSQPLAEGVYVNSAQYRGHPVWTASDADRGSRILFTALDGRWYVGGDGSEEQGWVRSEGPHLSRYPSDIPRWEVRDGTSWGLDTSMRVMEAPTAAAHLHLQFPPFLHQAHGWYQQVSETSWSSGPHSLSNRKGHWCLSRGNTVVAATMHPHYGEPPASSMEWVALNSTLSAEERQRDAREEADVHFQEAAELRAQAAALLEQAEAAEAEAQRILQAAREEAGKENLAVIEERKRGVARDAEDALQLAQQAVYAAERTRAATPRAAAAGSAAGFPEGQCESTSPARKDIGSGSAAALAALQSGGAGGLRDAVDAKQQDVRDQALYAARAASHAAEHARRLRDSSRPPSPAGAPRDSPGISPYTPASVVVNSSRTASAAPPPPSPRPSVPQATAAGIKFYVPGVPILCGTFTPVQGQPHLFVYNDFKIYDNNGYWAVGTDDDIAKGVGWLASIQKHHGKPPHHSTLEWRKWVGHSWEGDSGIAVTEVPLQ